jgi:iron(III) transport system ATP-binding protein
MMRTAKKKPAHAAGDQFPGISASGLSKRFRRRGSAEDVVAIDDVSLDVQPGELVVLLGPSGCGKTTLLRCIAGLETPDSGRIDVDNRTVYDSGRKIDMAVNRRDLSIIFQGYALWPHMTVQRNIEYPLRSRGERSAADIGPKVSRVLEMVGLGGLQKEYPGTLSGGQQQRVSLARALVADPAVILFDEPLSNVDAKVRVQLRREILTMHRRVGFAALYVTHDQDEALSLGNRIAVLDRGRIAQVGTPEEVYSNPASKYVAEFVGHANSLAVEVLGERDGVVSLGSDVGRFDLPATALPPGDKLTSGYAILRPEDIRLVSSADAQFSGKVVAAEYQGSHYEISVGAGSDTVLRVAAPKTSVPPGMDETVSLAINPAHIKVVPQ